MELEIFLGENFFFSDEIFLEIDRMSGILALKQLDFFEGLNSFEVHHL